MRKARVNPLEMGTLCVNPKCSQNRFEPENSAEDLVEPGKKVISLRWLLSQIEEIERNGKYIYLYCILNGGL